MVEPAMFGFVCVASALVAGITLFSGFGLGTLLMPAFALFFPVPVAVAATAVVHALNNCFKVALLHRSIDRRVLAAFGVPAVIAAFPGAWLLTRLSADRVLYAWELGSRTCEVTPVAFVMGLLILAFAAVELLPWFQSLNMPAKALPLGGIASGFFGGLSGHQGALRAIFLGPLRLSPAAFAATQAVIAVLVDIARISVYGAVFFTARTSAVESRAMWWLVGAATLSAFVGSYTARTFLKKVTNRFVHGVTSVLLVVVGLALLTGIV